MPPPPLATGAPPREPLQSQMRPKRHESTPRAPAVRSKRVSSSAPAANVDEVVADLRNDPRVDDDED